MNAKKENGKQGYIFRYLYYSALSMTLYQNMLFCPLPGCNGIQSCSILLAMLLVSGVLGYISLTAAYQRDWMICISIFAALELFTVVSHCHYSKIFAYVSVTVLSILLFTYLIWVWIRPIKSRRKSINKVIKLRLKQTCRYIVVLSAMALVPFSICIIALTFKGVLINLEVIKVPSKNYEDILQEDSECFMKLKEDNWTQLSISEKITVLLVVANAEACYLGVPFPIYVQYSDMNRASILGTYEYEKHVITINVDHLNEDPPSSVLDTLTHECYHAYQICIAQLLDEIPEEYRFLDLFNRAREYQREYSSYHSSGITPEEYWEYYTQILESDARMYAEMAVMRYYQLIFT